MKIPECHLGANCDRSRGRIPDGKCFWGSVADTKELSIRKAPGVS